jgi:hypothetical protein
MNETAATLPTDTSADSMEELAMQKAQQFAMVSNKIIKSELMGSCPAKTILGTVAGFGMGNPLDNQRGTIWIIYGVGSWKYGR